MDKVKYIKRYLQKKGGNKQIGKMVSNFSITGPQGHIVFICLTLGASESWMLSVGCDGGRGEGSQVWGISP